MAAKRVRTAPKKSGRRGLPGRGGTWTSRLQRYLRKLQDEYRPADRPFPKTPEQLKEEASQGIFNGDHVLRILDSQLGPWLDQLVVDRWGMLPRLAVIRNEIRRFREEAADPKARDVRAQLATRNRTFGLIQAAIKSVAFTLESERQQALGILDRQKISLWRVNRTSPSIGITVGPDIEESKHKFWTPLANHLLSYLGRAAPAATEQERFAVVATIFHFASEGSFPRGARGAALVKQRSYRSL